MMDNPTNGKMTSTELGKLAAEAIEKYCDAAAAHIEQVGEETFTLASSFREECRTLAAGMRDAAKIEAQRTVDFTAKLQTAALELKAIRERFASGGSVENAAQAAEKFAGDPESHGGPAEVPAP